MGSMNGKCPKCENLVLSLDAKPLEIHVGGQKWKGVTLHCPLCLTVLGASVDPVAVAEDALARIEASLNEIETKLSQLAQR